jgi:hypothetical protein
MDRGGLSRFMGSLRSRCARRFDARRRASTAAMLGCLAVVAMEAAFPDAHNPPPAGWSGPVFKLSQDYPATQPALEPRASGHGVSSISRTQPRHRAT